jgi:hypothetical protein
MYIAAQGAGLKAQGKNMNIRHRVQGSRKNENIKARFRPRER